jgi:hypothetical protein
MSITLYIANFTHDGQQYQGVVELVGSKPLHASIGWIVRETCKPGIWDSYANGDVRASMRVLIRRMKAAAKRRGYTLVDERETKYAPKGGAS